MLISFAGTALADAPSPDYPSAKEYLHWIITNAPNGDFSQGIVSVIAFSVDVNVAFDVCTQAVDGYL
jgi:hypothetical protein